MQDLIERLHAFILSGSESLGITIELATVLLLLLAGALGHWLLKSVVNRLHRLAEASQQNWDDVFVTALEPPLRVVIWVVVAFFLLRV